MSLVKVLCGVCVQYTGRALSLAYLISVEGVRTRPTQYYIYSSRRVIVIIFMNNIFLVGFEPLK